MALLDTADHSVMEEAVSARLYDVSRSAFCRGGEAPLYHGLGGLTRPTRHDKTHANILYRLYALITAWREAVSL